MVQEARVVLAAQGATRAVPVQEAREHGRDQHYRKPGRHRGCWRLRWHWRLREPERYRRCWRLRGHSGAGAFSMLYLGARAFSRLYSGAGALTLTLAGDRI